jgi:hypothetical protein
VNLSRFFSLEPLLELEPADIADVVRLSASESSVGAWFCIVAVSSFDDVGEGMFELKSSVGGKGGAVLERWGGDRSTLTGEPGELGSEYSAMGDA